MLYLTVFIFIKEGKETVFHDYEDKVLPILSDYNGTLIYRVRPTPETFIEKAEEPPYEIHFLSFENEHDFMEYTKDERRQQFLQLKEDAIRSTIVIQGQRL